MATLEGLFLDRDGVILEMVADPEHGLIDSARRADQVTLVEGVAELVATMNRAGIPVACLTNQPGVAKGFCQPHHIDEVHEEMKRQLHLATGAHLDHIGVCPHHPAGVVPELTTTCQCRKPAPGLLRTALDQLRLTAERVIFVGDAVTDVAAGHAAGTRTMLVGPMTPYLAATVSRGQPPTWSVPTLVDAHRIVVAALRSPPPTEGDQMPGQTEDFVASYLEQTAQIAGALDRDAVNRLVDEIRLTRDQGGRVFTAGNGGGAAHASHLASDLRSLGAVHAYCISDNVAELTARTNDGGWADSYAAWLQASRVSSADLLFVFSVGGGTPELGLSQNLVGAVDAALAVGAKVVGVTGPGGGYVAAKSTVSVQIPVPSGTGVTFHTEGLQAVIGHLIVADPRINAGTPTWELRSAGVNQ